MGLGGFFFERPKQLKMNEIWNWGVCSLCSSGSLKAAGRELAERNSDLARWDKAGTASGEDSALHTR